MTAWAWAALAGAASLITAALGDLVSEELRGWLDLAPNAILRLAATLLDPAQRETIYKDEWHPELCYILRGTESRPITRLIRGITLRVSPHTPFLPPLRAHPGPPPAQPSAHPRGKHPPRSTHKRRPPASSATPRAAPCYGTASRARRNLAQESSLEAHAREEPV